MSEEMWHVQMEPGDIKIVTLEQMDDMYRLELIASDTLVWQPGMPKALPLSVVAGIEDEESDVMEIEPELIGEPQATSIPAYIPPKAAPAPAPAPAAVPRQQTITPPPVAAAPIGSATAPAAPPLPTADFYSPESLRPITMSGIPAMQGGTGGGMAGKVVLGVAIAAGLLITLHRNDLLRPMAASAGQTAAYESLESSFGAPGFGTTRSVAVLSSTLNPPTPVEESTSITTPSSTTSDLSATSASDTESESEETSPSTAAADTPKKEETHSVTKKTSSAPATRPTPVRRTTKPASGGKKLKSFKSSEYDPMNAKL